MSAIQPDASRATHAKARRSWADIRGIEMLGWQAGLALVIGGFWEFASGRWFDAFFVSSPSAIGVRLARWLSDGSLWVHVWATLWATSIGFAIGTAIGLVLGLWLGLSPFAARLLDPFLSALNALPKVALAPLFILWFGIGIESKVALAAIVVLFLVFLNTFTGVREVDQDLIDAVRMMKARRSQVLGKVIIPSAASWVFASLKISVPYALIGAVLGEMIAANRGLGYLVQYAGAQLDTAGVFAALFAIAALAVALNALVDVFQTRAQSWRTRGK